MRWPDSVTEREVRIMVLAERGWNGTVRGSLVGVVFAVVRRVAKRRWVNDRSFDIESSSIGGRGVHDLQVCGFRAVRFRCDEQLECEVWIDPTVSTRGELLTRLRFG